MEHGSEKMSDMSDSSDQSDVSDRILCTPSAHALLWPHPELRGLRTPCSSRRTRNLENGRKNHSCNAGKWLQNEDSEMAMDRGPCWNSDAQLQFPKGNG